MCLVKNVLGFMPYQGTQHISEALGNHLAKDSLPLIQIPRFLSACNEIRKNLTLSSVVAVLGYGLNIIFK